ncbi:MAG: PEP-CTERM sorting domain-containing protein [Planctomycetes bacterium]|nr:PEP-CTERM sorting domain-containing protein [Planctomycetota bacterium]
MRTIRPVCPVALALFLAAISAESLAVPVTVSYELTSFGGERYRYDYDVTNVSLAGSIRELTIWFDDALYRNLVLATPDPPAANWSELVVQPAPSFHDDGFYDALAIGGGIAVGDHVSGFAVEFEWLGTGLPGSQPYDVVDPVTFQTQYADFTMPEPATLALLAGGLAFARRRR